MKKLFLFTSLFFTWSYLSAQVGINTTAPSAQLDIRSSSQTDPVNTDGILLPKIDDFPSINPTAAQDGMLVFVTGGGAPNRGFYYWNHTTLSWILIASGSIQDADWYKTETTETATALTDSIFTLGNVAIGKNTATASLDILNQDNERAINILIDGSVSDDLYGKFTHISNTGNGTHYGINSIFSGTGSGAHVGAISRFSSGSGNLTGKWTEFLGTIGNGNQLGAYTSYFAGGDGILAGSYTDIRSTVTGNGPQYGTFTTNSSPGTGFHYGHYTLLGGAGTGAQFGNYTAITNSNNSTHYGNYNVLSGGGDGIRYGVINFLTGVGNGVHYGVYNSSLASGDGTHHGTFNALGGEGNGDQNGTLNFMLNTGTGIHYGVRNAFVGEGSGIKYGTYNSMSGSGTGDQYGTYNTITNSANGTHYGVYNILSGTSSTAQYGVRSEFTGNGNAPIIGSRHVIFNSGNNEHWGGYTTLSGTGSGNKYGMQNVINNTGNGNHYGVDNTFSGPGSGFHAGIINRFTNGSGTLAGAWTDFSGDVGHGNQFGAYTRYIAGGNGILAGNYTEIMSTVVGSGPHYGTFSTNSSPGTGNKYGVFAEIDSSAGGTHYGIYSSTTNTTGWAGYFLGRMYVSQNMGLRINNPSYNLHIKQSANTAAGAGGIALELSTSSDNWKIYHSGASHLIFAQNGAARSYVQNATGAYIELSDQRLKKNIQPMSGVLQKVNQLKAYSYIYKTQQEHEANIFGFMAQEVTELFPELVSLGEDGYYGLKYNSFSTIAIKAIQEQQETIEQLTEANQDLRVKYDLLLQRIEQLESKY